MNTEQVDGKRKLLFLKWAFGGTELEDGGEVRDSSQSFSSHTLHGTSSEWSGGTTELVYTQ